MNKKIDLTRRGDFTDRMSAFFHRFTPLFHTRRFPWDDEFLYEDMFVNGDTCPWSRVMWEDVQEVFCYRCGKRLSFDLPWKRKPHDLCFECRNVLRLHDNISWTKQLFDSNSMKNEYDKVFLSEYRE